MDKFLQDLRFGIRQLRLSPGFTTVAVLSLALGIGANTAIFQLIDAIRLRALPVRKPLELGRIDMAPGYWRMGWSSTRSANFTYALWNSIRQRQQGFSDTMAWSTMTFNLAPAGQSRFVEGMLVSGEFFKVLGVPAILGRTFIAEDDRAGCGSPGAVISYAFWQSEFNRDPDVMSHNVRIDGHPYPIIGVTPPGFFGVEVGHRFDIAVPLCADAFFYEPGKNRIPLRHAWWLSMMGRLKPGWTIQSANVQLQAASPAIMSETLPE